MFEGNWGRIIITFNLVAGAAVSILVDWNQTHLFNPDWTPHAKFHDWAMLNLLSGVSILALWLMWRRSLEPNIGFLAATLIPIIFWAAFFYTSVIIPGTSLRATESEQIPTVAGLTIYPNLVVAIISVGLSVIGYYIYRREHPANRQSV